jgi:MFS family permease
MTTCLLGLALGQVVAGPVSDRYGRRGPLIAGLVIFVLASAVCAFSTSVAVLIALRLVQGLAGAVGLVIAEAAGRDIYEGKQLTRYYGRIVVLCGLGAIVAPVIGGPLSGMLATGTFHRTGRSTRRSRTERHPVLGFQGYETNLGRGQFGVGQDNGRPPVGEGDLCPAHRARRASLGTELDWRDGPRAFGED